MKIQYIRISTFSQKTDRQEDYLLDDKDIKRFKDVCSGSIAFNERDKGKRIIELALQGELKELHVHSLDRLGRSTLNIMQTIELLTQRGCNVISRKEGLRTLNDDGTPNQMAKLLIGILGTIAEFELNRIRERTQEGREIAKVKKKFKGRKKGTKTLLKPKDITNKYPKVVKALENKNSYRDTAKITGVSLSTVVKVMKAMEDAIQKN